MSAPTRPAIPAAEAEPRDIPLPFDFQDPEAAFALLARLLGLTAAALSPGRAAPGPAGPAAPGAGRLEDGLLRLCAAAGGLHARQDHRLFGSQPTPVAVFADLLISLLDVNAADFAGAPALGELERDLVDEIARRLRMPQAEGLFVPGGSLGNLQALAMLVGQARRRGGRIVALAQAGAHFSIDRALGLFGAEVEHRRVPVDPAGAMAPDALDRALAGARAEGATCIVISSYGLPAGGVVDPIVEIAALCERHGALHHIDAAYGGAALFLPERAAEAHAAARADSLCLDFHKWWKVSNPLSLVLSRHAGWARAAFDVEGCADLPAAADAPFRRGLPTTRRAGFLQLWLNLQAYGWPAFLQLSAGCIANARALEQQLAQRGLEWYRGGALSIVCCRPAGAGTPAVADLQQRLRDGGHACGTARIAGEDWLRLCFTQGVRSDAELQALADAIVAASTSTSPRSN